MMIGNRKYQEKYNMEKKDSLRTNYILQTFYRVLILFLPIITTPYVSRVLTSEGVGEFTYVSSVSYFFSIASNLGIANYGNRLIAEKSHDKSELGKAFCSLYLCHFFISLICIFAYIFFLKMFVHEYKNIFICELFTLLAAMFEITWFFTGLQKFRITVARSTLVRLMSVLLIFLFVNEREDVWKYVVILSGGQFIGQVVVWSQLKYYIKFVKVSISEIVKHLKPMLILFIPILATGLYRNMDKILLSYFSGASQTGLYGSTDRIMNIPLSVITAIGMVLLPKISELNAQGKFSESHRYTQLSMEYALWLASAMVFGLIGISPIFVPIFFGSGYEDCIQMISSIVITIFFLTWSDVIRSHYLIPNKKDKSYIISVFIGAIVNVVLDILLIPRFGAMGAIVGTIIAEFSVAMSESVFAVELNIRSMICSGLPFCLVGSIMCIFIRILGNLAGIHLWVLYCEIVIGGLFYIGITFIYMKKKKDPLWNYIYLSIQKYVKALKKRL